MTEEGTMSETKPIVAPVGAGDRIVSIDVLRGFAVLGILIINIQSFSMIFSAYLNPMSFGDLTGINRWVWILSHVLANMKFMTIFSLLFGAGIILFTQKAESKGLKPAGLHYRRTLWLLIIGLAHAYLLWHGDILVTYALCALWVYLFRRKTPKTLLIIAFILILIPSLLYFFFGWSIPFWPEESMQNNMQMWAPTAEQMSYELEAYRSGWIGQMDHRIPSSIALQTFVFLIFHGWRVTGLMLIGMALFKSNVLSAARSKKFYKWMFTVGLVIGLSLIITGVIRNFSEGWTLKYSMFYGWQFNYWGSLGMAAAYIALIMLVCQSAKFIAIKTRLAAAGRMAFTNYLLQTIICTTIFYGHGLGLFGKVERWGQALIMIGIWILILFISPIWLKHFRFGPVEWLWRTLTYLKAQPMRREPA